MKQNYLPVNCTEQKCSQSLLVPQFLHWLLLKKELSHFLHCDYQHFLFSPDGLAQFTNAAFRKSYLLVLLLFLCVFPFNKLHAESDINANNAISQKGTGYDANRGFYVEYFIKYYDNTATDEGILNANFWFTETNAGDITNVKPFSISVNENVGGENIPFKITAFDNFHIGVRAESSGSWGYLNSGQSNTYSDRSDSQGDFYTFIRVFIPQDYLNYTSLYWEFSVTSVKNIDKFKVNSQANTGNLLPSLSSVKASLGAQDGYYDINFSTSKAFAKTGTAKVYEKNIPGVYSSTSFSSNSTSSAITEQKAFLSSEKETRTAVFELEWLHSSSGYTYRLTKELTLPHLRVPKLLTATNNSDGTVRLTWEQSIYSTENSTPYTDGWIVSVLLPNNTEWTDLSPEVAYQSNANSEYSYSYKIPDSERMKGNRMLKFSVRRSCLNSDILAEETSFAQKVSATIQTDYEKPSLIVFDNATQKLYIKVVPGMKPDNLKHIVTGYIIKTNAAIVGLNIAAKPLPNDDPKKTEGFSYYLESNIQSCVPSRFEVQTRISENSVSGYKATLEKAMYKPDMDSEFLTFTASKGYYNDHVDLRWTTDPEKNNFSYFVISRYIIRDSILFQKQVAKISHDRLQNEYYIQDDKSSGGLPPAPGTYYRYDLQGFVVCDGTEVGVTQTLTDIGFAEAQGVVSGKITMTNGTAVRGVDIIFTNADGNESSLAGANKSLDFGSQDSVAWLEFPTPYIKGSKNLTIQFYAKIRNDKLPGEKHELFVGGNTEGQPQLELWLDSERRLNMKIFNNPSVTLDAVFPKNEYFQFSGVLTHSGGTYKLEVNVDGKLIGDLTVPESQNFTFTSASVSGKTKATKLDGLLDELRIWTRALNSDEIQTNYNRYISVKSSRALCAYYRFNEPNYVGNYVFDASFDTDYEKYNENHAVCQGMVSRNSDDLPTADQLAYKVQTDENGNYNSGLTLPFKNSGTTYLVKPSFGIHSFNPGNRTRTIDVNSSTHNGVDFTDISSFPVSITVNYANSNYPVDNVMVSIDGLIASKDGKAVMTDAFGEVTVDVPIGSHFISISKQGHTFANGGRFPKNEPEKYNFQSDGVHLQFQDQTTVRLAGRVAGGQPETNLPLGFGLSKANVGQASITLKTNNSYRFNLTESDSTSITQVGGKESTVTFKSVATGTEIQIKTNAETGEFLAELPPVPYKLTQIATKNYSDNFTDNDVVDFTCDVQSFNMDPNLSYSQKHTDRETGITESFSCHDSLMITRYEEPVIVVEDLGATIGAFGDPVYVFTNPTTGEQSNIPLYTENGDGTINYSLGVPVFSQKTLQYDWKIKAFERYANNDGDQPVYDVVPLKGNTVEINNALASLRVDIDTTSANLETQLSNASQSELVLDTAGVGYYSFKVGFPNINGNHQLSAKFTLSQNGKSYLWENSGILFGQLPSNGNNFVTKGPDAVDIVLHDPPGSNSYAYLAKGSSYTKTITRSDVVTTTQSEDVTIHVGPKLTTATGFGVMLLNEIQSNVDFEFGAEQEEVFTHNNERQTTTTFNQQISTSGDPNYVGSMADVYIGKSTNLVYGKMRQLALYPSNQDETGVGTPIENDAYRLFTKEVLTANQEFGTSFSYTQTYLINSQIPNIKALRNQLITPITNPNDTLNILFGSDKVKYFSFLPASNSNFGEPETYYAFSSPSATDEERIDEVQDYNTWIKNWEQRIADNEKAKLDLFDKRDELNIKRDEKLFENISYDAGVSLEKSFDVSYNNIEIDEFSFSAKGSFGLHSGFQYNRVGFEGHAVFGAGRDQSNGEITETGNSMTFGYVISEDESVLFAGKDALSIDVFGPTSDDMQDVLKDKSVPNLSGFTFRTRAGQTSCPFEPSDSTVYYTNSEGKHLQLNYGTFQIEKPQLYIDNKVMASAENIPTGRDASFTLQMQNNSEANLDVTYQLSVDGSSNPDGLILMVDGEPLTSPRQYRIRAADQVTKKLIVRQTSPDILEYSNIAIRLGSVCDNDEYSEAYISANFIPSSSDVSLSANATLLNKNTADENGESTVTFTIGDYDKSFQNFGCIRLQYRKISEESWTTLKTYVINESTFPIQGSGMVKIEDAEQGGRINYNFSYNTITPSDGEYIFRALSVSKSGNEEISLSSNEINIAKDMRSPQLLGNTLPANGILNPEDEISITFNEDIQANVLTKSNFSITGVLNASVRTEPTVGLAFSGTEKAFTEQPIYTNGSFSIESWIKQANLIEGTLFTYGESSNYLSLGFDASGHVVVTINGETKISTETLTASEVWKYIGISYNSESQTVSVYVLADNGVQTTLMHEQSFTEVAPTQGRFYVGCNAAGENGFTGAVALLNFYNTARSIADAMNSKNLTHSGNEPNLIGLWEMEEGEGTIAEDKARSRHLILNTSWYIYPEGKSLAFNGTNDYASVPRANYSFSQYNDFTWEFWFKAENQGAATLLSAEASASVGFSLDGKLVLTTNDKTQVLAAPGLLDNEWHHFALSVKRSGTTNAIIDGDVTASFNSSIFSGTIKEVNCIGAKWSTDLGVIKYSEYFKGNIDELRVWNTALTTKNILLDKNHKLRGAEVGLLVYYPFETYQKQDQMYSVYESLNDVVNPSLAIGNLTTTSNVAAPMQDCRPVTDVAFTFTASDRKIVFEITENEYKVEGVTLQIDAKDILDMHNNKSTSYRWTAYVNRNPLKWNSEPIKLVMEQNKQQSFTATFINRGGEKTAYYIENIPSWLTVSSKSGSLQPSSSKELTFAVAEGINIGSYEASIVLTGDNGAREILPITLKVTGQRPDWAVNPGDFEQSMTATGQILIEGYHQEDEDDLLAAFIGDKCVGLISPQYESDFQSYYVFLTIWGNSADDGKEVSFKIWDASTGQIYPVIELSLEDQPFKIYFTGDDIQGSVNKPIQFNARDIVEQSISLGKGWNWISENVENNDPTILNQFKEKALDFASQLKANGGGFINNPGESWVGTVTSLSVSEGYLVKTSREATLKLMGKAVKPAQAPMYLSAKKWSWIGYTPQFTMPVKEALAGIPNPQQGDQIKGQRGYRILTTNGWIGSLNTLEPGRGYMYRSNNGDPVTFNYPSFSTTLKEALIPDTEENENISPRWAVDYHRFAENMTVTASVFINEKEIQNGTYEIAAFNGDECRGSATLKYVNGFEHPYMGFLMVYGEKDDPLHFRIYNHTSGIEYKASEQLAFNSDSIYGTPEKLYALNSFTEINPDDMRIEIYPNPTSTKLYISRHQATLERIEVVDMSGRLLLTNKDFSDAFIDVSHLDSGSYLLKVIDNKHISVYKFIKK